MATSCDVPETLCELVKGWIDKGNGKITFKQFKKNAGIYINLFKLPFWGKNIANMVQDEAFIVVVGNNIIVDKKTVLKFLATQGIRPIEVDPEYSKQYPIISKSQQSVSEQFQTASSELVSLQSTSLQSTCLQCASPQCTSLQYTSSHLQSVKTFLYFPLDYNPIINPPQNQIWREEYIPPRINSLSKDLLKKHFEEEIRKGSRIGKYNPGYWGSWISNSYISYLQPPKSLHTKPMLIHIPKPQKIRIANYPISTGGFRVVYLAQIRLPDGCIKEFVVKQYMDNKYKSSPKPYIDEAYNSACFIHLAQEFSSRYEQNDKIEYIPSKILTIRKNDVWQIFNIEQVLDTRKYQKWTCNNSKIIRVHKGLLDFTLWSYYYSKGNFIVSDLQGVLDNGRLQLTDPAMLCRIKGRFGMTNCHENIDKFIESIETCYRTYGFELPLFYTKMQKVLKVLESQPR